MAVDEPITALFCTDGSALSLRALRRAREVIRTPDRAVVATVVEVEDPLSVSGIGHSAAVLSPIDLEQICRNRAAEGHRILDRTVADLDLGDPETVVLYGDSGTELLRLAESLRASLIVAGTRGRGGWQRAVLGSVSDHLVRHAQCPVLTVHVDHHVDHG
jgi:nucleotide-binding universal stress UspA family protein